MHTDLVKAIKENKLVFFIGSGLSRSLGFPNWTQLVKKIIDDLAPDYPDLEMMKPLVGTPHFSEMEILDKLIKHKPRIHEILDKEFSFIVDNQEALQRHVKIGNITSKLITTNYDNALETAIPNAKKITYDNGFHVSRLNNTDRYIYKLHGSIENPETCILFSDDYKNLYNNPTNMHAIEELRKIIGDNTIVFLGFSLSDPYVYAQFQYINTIYNGLKGKHFLITTDDSTKLEGIDTLCIENWDDSLNKLLDSFLEIKGQNYKTDIIKEQFPISEATGEIQNLKIAILISAPMNKNFGYDLNKILKQFSNMNVTIDCYHLTISSLNKLEGYNFILIFSSSVQNKVYIEDENLVGKLISLENLQSELLSVNVNGLFVFSDKDKVFNTNGLFLPFVFKKYDEKTFNSFIFKTFRKGDIANLNEEAQLINDEKFNLLKIPQGRSKVTNSRSDLPNEIDRKKLINFTGRASDLENIIRKILELNGQLLTIKASGGIGKTTTIKKAAIELADRGYFNDGIHFIDCEFITDFNTFEYKVSQCFDLDRTINLKEHMKQNIFGLDKLIILDNFESLLYLNDTSEIKNLVAFLCDYATISTTSRQWIGFEFEEEYELRALTTDECVELFQKYYTNEINTTEMKILRNDIIENLLNNNPLAVKIITSNIPKLKSMKLLRDDLEEDFFNTTKLGFDDIFVESVDNNIEKSKSLYQSINYSYSKLSSKEKLVFELLSLFPDGIHFYTFVQMFKGVNYKKDINRITDKEIKSLENKSLLQNSSATIKLQSIVGRFAAHKFNDRNVDEKKAYYDKAYEYNAYSLQAMETMENKSQLIEIFDYNMENLFSSLNYLEHVSVANKISLLKYITNIATYSNDINQAKKYEKNIRGLKDFFQDVDKADMLIDTLIYKLRYYEGEFRESLIELQKSLPLDRFFALLNSKDFVNAQIYSNAASIYKYGNELKFINESIKNKTYKNWWIGSADLLFSIGAYKLFSEFEEYSTKNKESFFSLEVLFNLGTLELDYLNTRIDQIYKKEHLSIMQFTYIKAKMGVINKHDVRNLVVVNPYSFGLKNLMYAFLEKDFKKAITFYETAIENLEHIKYYYVEAIYYYAAYLKNQDNKEYDSWVKKGIELAREYQYRFLIHKFDCLLSDVLEPFSEEKYKIDIDLDYFRKNLKTIKELVST
ncbi:SIR2 family protein [Psychrobacillus sp. FJAT-51614]|uniref:SIR2 family protein n=1 Tax=Psychrobacillus mangrovi TaxID=3117745 RepID=A0ABU8F787_9BACI